MVVDPLTIWIPGNLSTFLKMVNVVPKCLLIPRQAVKLSALNEQFLQNVIHRRHAVILVLVTFEDPQDGAAKRFFVKCFVFCQLFAGILRNDIHGVILGNGWSTGWFNTEVFVMRDNLRLGEALQFQILNLLHRGFCQHSLSPPRTLIPQYTRWSADSSCDFTHH